MQRIEFRAMGSQMLAAIDADTPEAQAALQAVPGMFAEWEQHLSRFLDGSELNRLNKAGGQPMHVGTVLWDVLGHSLEAAEQSGGLVTPALLDVLEASGYDRSFDVMEADRQSTSGAKRVTLAEPAPARDWRTIQLDHSTRSVQLPAGMRIDFGGVAKGWAADEAAAGLAEHGPSLVDAGGDIAVSGAMSSGEGWPVGVSDPFTPGRELELLIMGAGGVATSGRDYRKWRVDGRWQHHIIDPRTGQPADTDVLSATVVGPSAREAETAAKVVLILGSREGLKWLEARPKFAGMLVLEEGTQIRSSRFDAYIWKQT